METITENYLFKKAYSKGNKQAGKLIVIYSLKRKHGIRCGVTVSKKIGKAVVRNRVRRIIKECFRYLLPYIKENADIVFVARSAAVESSFADLFHAMKSQLIAGGLLSEESIDFPY